MTENHTSPTSQIEAMPADDGVATRKADNLVQAVRDAIRQPTYPDSVS